MFSQTQQVKTIQTIRIGVILIITKLLLFQCMAYLYKVTVAQCLKRAHTYNYCYIVQQIYKQIKPNEYMQVSFKDV